MEKSNAVAALAALAQDNRLDVFRLLVEAGPDGMPAGEIASALKLAPNTLTFHFDRLRMAGLVTVRRHRFAGCEPEAHANHDKGTSAGDVKRRAPAGAVRNEL